MKLLLHMIGNDGAFDMQWDCSTPAAPVLYVPTVRSICEFVSTPRPQQHLHRKFLLHCETKNGAIYIEESAKP